MMRVIMNRLFWQNLEAAMSTGDRSSLSNFTIKVT